VISGVTIIPFDCLIGVSASPTIVIFTEGIEAGLEDSSRDRVLSISSGPTQSRAIASGKIVIAILSGAVIALEMGLALLALRTLRLGCLFDFVSGEHGEEWGDQRFVTCYSSHIITPAKGKGVLCLRERA